MYLFTYHLFNYGTLRDFFLWEIHKKTWNQYADRKT